MIIYLIIHIKKCVSSQKHTFHQRTIQIPDVLRCQLIEYYASCKQISGFSDKDFVFGITKPFATTTVERRKNKAIEKAGLHHIRLHDFRHSHASFLINNKVPPLYISKRLGHKDLETTLRIYVHMFDQQNQVALDIMNKVIEKMEVMKMERTFNEFYNVLEEDFERITGMLDNPVFERVVKDNVDVINKVEELLRSQFVIEEVEVLIEELVNSFNCITLIRDKYLFSYAYHLGVINGSKTIGIKEMMEICKK